MGQFVASLVTDEIVEKAARAQWDALRDRVGVDGYELDPFEGLEPDRQAAWFGETRAGLEAVVGDIIDALGLKEDSLYAVPGSMQSFRYVTRWEQRLLPREEP